MVAIANINGNNCECCRNTHPSAFPLFKVIPSNWVESYPVSKQPASSKQTANTFPAVRHSARQCRVDIA